MIGLAALVTALSACGSAESPTSLLAISPASPEVAPGDAVKFIATSPAAPDATVAWAVVEPDGGTIDGTGVYTAPTAEGTFTVTASLTSLSTTQATQVRVKRNVRVDVSPSTATVVAGDSITLGASVTGAVKTVTWAVAEGTLGGAITEAGVYTAPSTAGVYDVVATSTIDPTKSGSATITVTAQAPAPAPAAVTIAASPQAASVIAGNSVQFTAAVTGSTNVGVTWSVAESGGGSVGATGLYTAPATAGSYHVVATSSADTSKTSSAAVTVTAPPAPTPTPTPTPTGVGTGAGYTASNITGVTGGGAMPSWTTNVVTAACAGNGVTDDTSCLQAAANASRDQNKPLVIPATSAHYRITNRITIYKSVGGINGRPTIRSYATCGQNQCGNILLAPGFTGWVYNLNLVGTYTLNGASTGEWAHNIDIGSANGVTIKANVLENAMGDAVSNNWAQWDSGNKTSNNVLVDGNTMRNPNRCAVAFVYNATGWVITNNLIEKQNNFVSAIDYEPEIEPVGAGHVQNVEISYNKFIMDNRTVNPNRWGDGKAIFGWAVPGNGWPADNLFHHHNYGTFGTGFWGSGGNFTSVTNYSNAEGSSPP